MLKKIKSLFKQGNQEGVDLSRRRFIRDAGALAALTVAAGSVPSLLKLKSIEEQISSGYVSGQTFYINEPIVIDFPNVTIDQCKFIATAPMDYMVQIGPNAKDCMIKNSYFETRGMVGVSIRLLPQPEYTDMTKTFQSAIGAARNSGGTVLLTEGAYYTNQPIKIPSNFNLKGKV
jgi:hypothetical protein